jgi:hypothetical protein
MKKENAAIIMLAMAASAGSALAVEWRLGEDTQLKVSGTVTFGTGIRTENPRPENYGSLSGSRVGRSDGLTAANSGGPDLNFEQGKAYSTVLKAFADFDIGRRSFGAFARLKGWYDYELEKGDRAYGNYPNAFAQNEPLSDNGFAPEAKFSNALFTAAYLYGGMDLGRENRLEGRLGRQFVNWGTAQSITGGINVINPRDLAAAVRPGALPQETRIPVGMVYANFAAGKQWGMDAVVPYESRHDVIAGCGTYFNVATYAPTGCEMATVTLPAVGVLASPASRTEPALLASGRYVHRAPDVEAKDGGEFGVSLRYALAQLGTEVRGYAMNYHSRAFMLRGTNPNIPGVGGGYGQLNPFTGNFNRLTDPNGVKYALVYPEDIHLFGLSFDTRRGQATRVFGEIAYRPNQPLSINLPDVADAFVARNPNSILNRPASGKNALALPPGANFDAYDRFKVTTASFGVGQGFPGVLGSQRVIAGVELGWSHVSELPDPGTIRYGRSDAYGTAAVPGFACTDSYPGKTCAHDGFVTRNAWGYRARIASTYNDAFLGAALTPSLFVAHDVKGYSHDGTFLEDRMLYGPGLRAEWGKTYFAEAVWTRYSNKPRYSMLIDRDNVQLMAGAHF